LVVGGDLLDYLFHHIWRWFQSFEEVVHCFPASYCVSCFSDQCFEVTDGLVNELEFEVVFVKGCLSCFLLSGVRELGLKAVKKVGVSVFDVVLNGVELFYRLEHRFYPPIYLWPFDKCEGDGDAPDW